MYVYGKTGFSKAQMAWQRPVNKAPIQHELEEISDAMRDLAVFDVMESSYHQDDVGFKDTSPQKTRGYGSNTTVSDTVIQLASSIYLCHSQTTLYYLSLSSIFPEPRR